MMSRVQNKQITMSSWVSLGLPSSPPGPSFYALFYAHKQRRLQEVYERLDCTLSPALTLNIVQKQVIVHVEGVDVISVRQIFIFYLCSCNNFIQDVSRLCSRHSRI